MMNGINDELILAARMSSSTVKRLARLGCPKKRQGMELAVIDNWQHVPYFFSPENDPHPVPISRAGSRRTQLRKLSSTRPFASTASSKKTSIPFSTRAAMAQCGISPRTSIPSN